ncbi:OLC1v1038647C1 [Oldenlandia corymbosa var. corymbosa]|uniref:Glucose-6-phosphate 1-dehydrogenase n=1 Tax=Oldenlandia corymbosa var. corymbosa TaxID=529605 RepID=A0AAV1D1T7_OLDCO|nr:OLC1v1038647C1 [Oldenlandia corymbosa var. corymbosa]
MSLNSLLSQNLSSPTWETSSCRQIHRRATSYRGFRFTDRVNGVVVSARSHQIGCRRALIFCDSNGRMGATSILHERIPISTSSLATKSGIRSSSDSSFSTDIRTKASFQDRCSSASSLHLDTSSEILNTTISSASMLKNFTSAGGHSQSLSIVVIGATGELARRKIFPALFALFYSGFLPENFSIFGYSRKDLTDEVLRSMIASTLTCRIDHQKNCEDQMDAFLRRIYYVNGGFDNREGMPKLAQRMEQAEDPCGANRIFYLSVPQEALIDVASALADLAQSQTGWNRIIVEKPFGYNPSSSDHFTKFMHSKFEEQQLYRIDHLLGRNTIENLAVLRFSNLVFMPLWNRNYIENVQVIWSDDFSTHTQSRYLDGNGIIGDVVHSHILQTIALLTMEPPISLDGEDVRNEKVKVMRSMKKLDPTDVIIGRCKGISGSNAQDDTNYLAPTYFAAALYIDNARWDGVPFLIKAGRGLGKHRVEIRIRFRHVPGNLYHKDIGTSVNLATNELILRDMPDEAILVKVNNKYPGLGMELGASELNLLYKDKYNIEVPDSYEQLLHDVIDGDNHLFMRSDEVSAAWNILSPVLTEMGKNNIASEVYEIGGRGPDKAVYLWAKHGVQWLDD